MLDTREVHAIMMELPLDHIGAVIETQTLPSGFHPLSAKDTPHGARLHLDEPDDDMVVVGWVVTDWEGNRLNPRLPITGSPSDTVGDAVNKVVKIWAGVLRSIRTGTEHDMPELIRRLTPHTSETAPDLQPGDYIAYLLPDIPPFIQNKFITTKITGVNPLILANGHHKTIFASGRGEVARFNPESGRVVFPVVKLRLNL